MTWKIQRDFIEEWSERGGQMRDSWLPLSLRRQFSFPIRCQFPFGLGECTQCLFNHLSKIMNLWSPTDSCVNPLFHFVFQLSIAGFYKYQLRTNNELKAAKRQETAVIKPKIHWMIRNFISLLQKSIEWKPPFEQYHIWKSLEINNTYMLRYKKNVCSTYHIIHMSL